MVSTITIFIISRILYNLSQSLRSDLVQQRIDQIDDQDSQYHSVNVGADIAD